MLITKDDLIKLGFGNSQASDIIRKAKKLMVSKGFTYYDNRRLGKVPIATVEEILGMKLDTQPN